MHNDVENTQCTCYKLLQRISQLIKSIYINFLEQTVAFNSLQHSIILHLCLLTAFAIYTLQNTALPIPEWLCNFWEYATQTWPHNVGFKSHFLWQFKCLNPHNQSNSQYVNMFLEIHIMDVGIRCSHNRVWFPGLQERKSCSICSQLLPSPAMESLVTIRY